ncbi:MFS transporter [Actinomyces haliotis]|uniref:MFS transporter n=1 Tax=Actinomyces haliotis TaxID=1280843 RepID=UPI00188FBE3A|nr:MFS transporter [Actinomyces haliotis]
MSSTFDSLRFHNYRTWFFAALVANTGTWMQRVAQDWLVLRILTNDSASATGITTALQFLPAMIFSVHAGLVADRVDQRRFLVLTQTSMGLVSLALGADVLAGHAELWHVYLAALLTGCASAYDSPARQIFVARMVPGDHLANAVGLNSASFNAARLIGPAVGGLAITWVGPGWVFVVNALTFLFPAAALLSMRVRDLYDVPRAQRAKGQMREGLAYVRHRADIVVIIVVISVVSMFTLNFQVTMAAMVRHAFNLESDAYGTVSSVFAIGSLGGALWAARRKRPRVRTLITASCLLGVFSLVMAAMPTYPLFALSSIPVGLCVLTVLTSANQIVQLTTEPAMRGRVMSIYMMFFLGTTPIGSPLIGWVSDEWSPRVAIAVGGAAAILVSLLAALWARRHWHVDLTHSATRAVLSAVGRGGRTSLEAPGPLAGEAAEAAGSEMLAEITGGDDEFLTGLDGVGGASRDAGTEETEDAADGDVGPGRADGETGADRPSHD